MRIALKNRDSDNRWRDLPEWLDEFTDNLEDTEVHTPADSERVEKMVSKSRKHKIYTHFPKDRNCVVCFGTKMTRTPCRRRTGEALPRAEKFGDLITSDYKVVKEDGESRNNNRYAVVVQDLATQWIQFLSVQNKDFTRDGKEFTKVPRATTRVTSYLYGQFSGIWKNLVKF